MIVGFVRFLFPNSFRPLSAARLTSRQTTPNPAHHVNNHILTPEEQLVRIPVAIIPNKNARNHFHLHQIMAMLIAHGNQSAAVDLYRSNTTVCNFDWGGVSGFQVKLSRRIICLDWSQDFLIWFGNSNGVKNAVNRAEAVGQKLPRPFLYNKRVLAFFGVLEP